MVMPNDTKGPAALWGQRIAERREHQGLTQNELADAAETTQQHISSIESGDKQASDALRMRIANALKTHPADLFPWPSVAS